MVRKNKKIKYSFLQRNGLTLVFILLFLISFIGQIITGFKEHNEYLADHKQQELSSIQYLNSGHFLQATFENWESEFLQMAMFVLLTIWLRQKGSSESKPMEGDEEVEKEPTVTKDAPWPVKAGGFILTLYKNSLSIALFLLFIISFVLHWHGSFKDYNLQQLLENKPTTTAFDYLSTSKFWFESFQNWQSEFLSVAAIVILSVYFRQKGSAQSKPVNMPDGENKE